MSGPGGGALPLSGRRILVTRSPEQSGEFALLLRSLGAEVVAIPLIRFDPPDSWETADRAIDGLSRFSLILFTSANAVEFFLRRLRARGAGSGALGSAALAAIGPKTAETLQSHGLRVEIVAEEFVAEGLLAALKGRGVEGNEILIPRAEEAREVLVEELEKRGARVTVAPVYRTVRADESREPLIAALKSGVAMVTFTASSTVRHFMDLLGPEAPALMSGVRVACIGRITADAARARGLTPDVVPGRSTVSDLAEAIAVFFVNQPPRSSSPAQ